MAIFCSSVVLGDVRSPLDEEQMMRVSISSLVVVLFGGGVLFVAACILEFIVSGVLGFVFFEFLIGTGFGVPFRFFQLGLLLTPDYFSISRLVLDWLIWCLVFAALFYGIRALVHHS
jgi:hypothetical protein